MKKTIFLTIIIFTLSLVSINSFSQKSYGGLPISFTNKQISTSIDHIIVPQPDMYEIMQEDMLDEKNGEMYKIGRVLPINVSMENSGTWDVLPDGTEVWRLKISSAGAKSITLLYSNFYLPEGSQLFLYNENKNQILGSFDNRTNPKRGNRFSTQMIQGETTYIEYIKPVEVTEEAIIEIEDIVYNYRNVEPYVGYYKSTKDTGFGNSQSCEVNVNCPEGNDWQTQKRAVAEIYIVQGFSAGFCTGTLVNNTANDGTPYFLTADHCGGTSTTMDQWQFYFHFEAPTCTTPATEPSYETVIGSTFRARGPQSGGSDFLLLELNTTETELQNINAYYCGWDRSSTPSPSGIGIHHPAGDIKKISRFGNSAVVGSYTGCLADAHWQVTWSPTATDHGVTEGGSSGSAIFNETSKLVVGTLTGGGAACNNQTAPDFYGRFDIHWETNGSNDADRLKPWLDPANTGDMTCPGREPGNANPGNPPVADFNANPTTVEEGGTVNFTDLSTNNPTSWSWSFPGGTPNTSNIENPSVVYNNAGIYDVTLTATNADGNDQEVKTQYIEVIVPGALNADFTATPTVVAVNGTVNFTNQSTGTPTSWNWAFEGGNPATSNDQNPSVTYPTQGVYSVTLTVSDGTDNDEEIKNGYITVTENQGELTAAFVASAYDITAGECINFNDQSTGLPTSWSWSFPGAQTISSTNQNPTNICYNTPGIYDVVLQVQNSSGQDTHICEDCITVNPDPNIPIANFEADHLTIPVGGVVHFTNLSENGPFNQWAWSFEGGTPGEYPDSAPPPIAYMTAGTYDVTLRCRKTNNVQDILTKTDYITVIPPATEAPTANFSANYTVIQPGEQINFTDLSLGLPYQWEWEFEGANTTNSNLRNPTGIQYDAEGTFYVKLKVTNNFGSDELVKEAYIVVSNEDPCTESPTPDFTSYPRLVPAGSQVYFESLSEGLPSNFSWVFEGGVPSTSTEGSPTTPILYNTPGIYDVTLTVSNGCGANSITKSEYIYVFSGPVHQYCDTITTVIPGETIGTWVPTNQWGFLAGHNGDKIKKYANYFNTHTFSQVTGLIVPITHAVYGSHNNRIKFCIWEGNENGPVDSLKIGEKRVYIRDLTEDQANVIHFDEPVNINGPFYAGFEISYRDENNDGANDDLFAMPIVTSRGANPTDNDLFLYKSGQWFSTNSLYNFSSAIPIKPISCLVDIEELLGDYKVELYPNPSYGISTLTIKDNTFKDVEIEVYDAIGRKIQAVITPAGTNDYNINMQSYPEGLYIIKIRANNKIVNKKLILSQ